MHHLPLVISVLVLLFTSAGAHAGPTFRISLERGTVRQPQTGRLIIFLIREGADVPPHRTPADGPFWDDPQPMFGHNINHLIPGEHIDITQPDDAFPAPLADLPAGRYRAQAVLDVRSEHSDWKREPGNLYSNPIGFTWNDDEPALPVELRLNNLVEERPIPEIFGVEIIEVRSRLLSQFHGRDVYLRAAVVLPANHDAGLAYPAIYEVPGFGGDHFRAFDHARERFEHPANSPAAQLNSSAFWIILDPESANGHTLFADSANNGPRGRALVTELIPAIEAKYNLIAQPTARLLRGHSSGGWSTIWLAITYPETFSAAWSTAPDPVAFQRFQLVNIYEQPSMYTEDGKPIPSYRDSGKVKMSIAQENHMEQVLGPSATSAQQWASWQAVFGPRRQWGGPAMLYDPRTGDIDHEIAETYRAFDITERVRQDHQTALIFRQRIRLIVGDQDNYYLHEAVELLRQALDDRQFLHFPEGEHGTIRIIPGHDHSSIKDDASVRDFPRDMLEHLKRHGHTPRPPAPRQ